MIAKEEKDKLKIRNMKICEELREGKRIEEVADKYGLTKAYVRSIKRLDDTERQLKKKGVM